MAILKFRMRSCMGFPPFDFSSFVYYSELGTGILHLEGSLQENQWAGKIRGQGAGKEKTKTKEKSNRPSSTRCLSDLGGRDIEASDRIHRKN